MNGEPSIIVYECDEMKIENKQVEICDDGIVITDWIYEDTLGNKYYAILYPIH